MSEDKNTALGSPHGIGYSHLVPSPPNPATNLMITTALVLTALVLVTSWDNATSGRRE